MLGGRRKSVQSSPLSTLSRLAVPGFFLVATAGVTWCVRLMRAPPPRLSILAVAEGWWRLDGGGRWWPVWRFSSWDGRLKERQEKMHPDGCRNASR